MAADTLSRPPESDEGKQDNQQITMLPEEWVSIYPIEPLGLPLLPFWKDISG